MKTYEQQLQATERRLDGVEALVNRLSIEMNTPFLNVQVSDGAQIVQNKISTALLGSAILMTGHLTLNDDITSLYNGLATLVFTPAGAVAYATGSALAWTAAGTTGQPLLSGGAGVPTWGTLSLANGGTSVSLTAASGAIPSSTATALALLPAGTAGAIFYSGGVGSPGWSANTTTAGLALVSGNTTTPTWFTGTAGGVFYGGVAGILASTVAGTAGQAVLSGGAGAPTMGTLGLTYGGTAANLSALTNGALIYATGSALGGSSVGTFGQVLYSGGAGSPGWTTTGISGQPLLSQGGGVSAPTFSTLGLVYGGTNTDLSGAATGSLFTKGASAFSGALAPVATGQVLISAGLNTIPAWSASPTVTTLTTTNLVVGGGATFSKLDSGTSTTAPTAVANITGTPDMNAFWVRIGNYVFMWGHMTINPSVASTATQLTITLPVTGGNFTTTGDCAGTMAQAGAGTATSSIGIPINANSGAATANVSFVCGAAGNADWFFHLSYIIR